MRALALLLLLVAAPASAQGVAEPREFADRAVRVLTDGRGAAFLDVIERESALGEIAAGAQFLRENRLAWVRQLDGFGLAVGWEYAGAVEAGPSLRRLCYLVRFRRAPLLVQFDFYRADRAWDMINALWVSGRDIFAAPCVATRPRTEPAE